MQYFPNRRLESPVGNPRVSWDYDPQYAALKALLAELKALDPRLQLGTRGQYDLSEEIVLRGELRLQLSYVGPYAALNFRRPSELVEESRELASRVRALLQRRGVTLLTDEALNEEVPWIIHASGPRKPRVWNCLFVLSGD